MVPTHLLFGREIKYALSKLCKQVVQFHVFDTESSSYTLCISVADPGEGPGIPPPPLIFRPNIFFWETRPLSYGWPLLPPSPPPPPYLKVRIRHCIFYRGTYSEQRHHTMCHVVSHRGAKTMENYRIVRPEKRSWSLLRGGRFREILTVGRWLGKIWCQFWILSGRVGGWSLTSGGGHIWRFDCIMFFHFYCLFPLGLKTVFMTWLMHSIIRCIFF